MRIVFWVLVFLAELAAWAAFGVVAWHLAGGGLWGWIAAGVAVAIVIGLWALLAAPKASAPRWAALLTKAVVFGGAVVGLFVVPGYLAPALALAALVVVAHAGMRATGGPPEDMPMHGRSD